MNVLNFFIILSIIFSSIQYILTPFAILDFTLLLIIEYTVIEKDFKRGIIVASLLGIIQDILTGSILGFNLFVKSLFFYLIFLLKDKFFFKNFLVKIFAAWFLFILEFFIQYNIFKIFSYSTVTPNFKDLLPFFVASPLILLIINILGKRLIKIDEI